MKRYCELNNIPEEKNLVYGLDYRLPQYRRETFLRFYEFHLKYRGHPGYVYAAFPYLRDKLGWDEETTYWAAFLNGTTQNIVTTKIIMDEFPSIPKVSDIHKMDELVQKHWSKMQWDIDRKYFKIKLGESVASYIENLNGKTQKEFFYHDGNVYENFEKVWASVIGKFAYFGRLSTFSYLEYLKIIGVNIDCNNLFLEDMAGSKSHRNGLCKVLGRDDFDDHKSNPNFVGGYSKEVLEWLKVEAALLLQEAKERFKGKEFFHDVNYFTLESTLCCYKSWYRKNRRYPNVYVDMFYDRITYAEKKWAGERNFDVFWQMRKDLLPINLRLEDNPNDVGLKPEKQNHFRLTGQPIMMNHDWECFKNDYNDRIESQSTLESLF